MNKINIVACVDNNYVQHLGTMLCSLLENTHYTKQIHIYIIEDGIKEKYKEKLRELIEKYKSKVTFKNINKKKFENFKIYKFITSEGLINQSMYYRIESPNLLKEIDKAIYLDCDLIVVDDIVNLWKCRLGDKVLGAVNYPYDKRTKITQKILGISQDCKYFNSGVLLINFKKWRKEKIDKKIYDIIRKKGEIFGNPDQDALNIVLHNKYKELDSKWNTGNINPHPHPSIIHFTGLFKPSDLFSIQPDKDKYQYYLKKIPFKTRQKISLKTLIKYLRNVCVNYVHNYIDKIRIEHLVIFCSLLVILVIYLVMNGRIT